MVYPALLQLMRTPRLPVVDRTDPHADVNGLVSFGERRNLVSARVPSRFGERRNLVSARVPSRFGERRDLLSARVPSRFGERRDLVSARVPLGFGERRDLLSARVPLGFGERRDLLSACVPSHFKRILPASYTAPPLVHLLSPLLQPELFNVWDRHTASNFGTKLPLYAA